MPTLTAAATATTQIRLGTLVASPNFRHPVPFARELLALDDVSNGRLIVGIGAGGVGWDATTLGNEAWAPDERAGRFAEFVELLDRLLREPVTDFRGEYYAADGARSHPGPVQQPRPPFAIAAIGPRGMRLAATHGETWVTTGDRKDQYVDAATGSAIVAEQIGRLTDVCAAVERDPETLDRLVLLGGDLATGLTSVDAFVDTVGRYEEVGVTDLVVPWPRATEPYKADLATFEAAVLATGTAD